MADSLLFAARIAATGYALRANARQHEKPTTVRFSLVHCTLEGFALGASIDLKRGLRINVVSPTMLEESVPSFGPYFPGFDPVSSSRVGLAYVRSIEGGDTGQVYRVGY